MCHYSLHVAKRVYSYFRIFASADVSGINRMAREGRPTIGKPHVLLINRMHFLSIISEFLAKKF